MSVSDAFFDISVGKCEDLHQTISSVSLYHNLLLVHSRRRLPRMLGIVRNVTSSLLCSGRSSCCASWYHWLHQPRQVGIRLQGKSDPIQIIATIMQLNTFFFIQLGPKWLCWFAHKHSIHEVKLYKPGLDTTNLSDVVTIKQQVACCATDAGSGWLPKSWTNVHLEQTPRRHTAYTQVSANRLYWDSQTVLTPSSHTNAVR